MKVYALSDIHLDYSENQRWLSQLSSITYQNDILILAGDISDDLHILESCFSLLSEKFLQVMYVPGNHELWVVRNKNLTSMEKFELVCNLAIDSGIRIRPYETDSLLIVPILSWYDFSFGTPGNKLRESWMDFHACKWPDGYSMADVARHFMNKNNLIKSADRKTTISFSHFLPRLDLLPERIPDSYQFLHPILGSDKIEEEIRKISSDIHVYGHSHVNTDITIDGVRYINNAFGYPRETRIARKQMLCIHEDQAK